MRQLNSPVLLFPVHAAGIAGVFHRNLNGGQA
jgi:hypothetical protein